MSENERISQHEKRRKSLYAAIVIAVLGAIAEAVVAVMRDTIIVYSGIRSYSTAVTAAHIVLAAGLILTVINGIRVAAVRGAMSKEQARREEEMAVRMAKQTAEPVLKVKGALDPVQIGSSLRAESDKWAAELSAQHSPKAPQLRKELSEVQRTMERMDEYQSKLKSLLDTNGAEALRDTEDILTNAEQHICRNIRKLLNIMTVSSSGNEEDVSLVISTAQKCGADNNALLGTTKEFMVAVTQLLNAQGDDSSGIRELEAYKKAIASQIDEGGIY